MRGAASVAASTGVSEASGSEGSIGVVVAGVSSGGEVVVSFENVCDSAWCPSCDDDADVDFDDNGKGEVE